MEVILAQKNLQERLTASASISCQRIAVDMRVIVKEGREFASFRCGDEGTVLSVDKEAGNCEVVFDGSVDAIMVALRHLSVAGSRGPNSKASPGRKAAAPERGASPSAPSTSAGDAGRAVVAYRQVANTISGGKRTVSRFKQVVKSKEASPEHHKPAANGAHESRSLLSPMGAPCEEPADAVAMLRRAVHESASAIEASLRVAQAMKIEQADVLGERNKVIVLSEDAFSEWQQAVHALQIAAGLCSKALRGPTRGSSIAVPVETIGFRPPQMPGIAIPNFAWPPMPPLFRAPPSFGLDGEAAMARSTSAPQLDVDGAEQFYKWSSFSNTPALVSPRSTSGFLPGGPTHAGGAAPLFSPQTIQGGVSSASKMCSQPLGGFAFVPSHPALTEATAPGGVPGHFASDAPTPSSPRFAQAGPPLLHGGLVPPTLMVPEHVVPAAVHQRATSVPARRPPHADVGRCSHDLNYQLAEPPHGHHDHHAHHDHDHGHHDHERRPVSKTTPGGRALRPPKISRPTKLANWLNQELANLHRGLLGGGDSESDEYEEFTYAL